MMKLFDPNGKAVHVLPESVDAIIHDRAGGVVMMLRGGGAILVTATAEDIERRLKENTDARDFAEHERASRIVSLLTDTYKNLQQIALDARKRKRPAKRTKARNIKRRIRKT